MQIIANFDQSWSADNADMVQILVLSDLSKPEELFRLVTVLQQYWISIHAALQQKPWFLLEIEKNFSVP